MKVKLNLDKKAIQEFFLQHVEKIVFGGVIFYFALMVYGALGRDSFDKTPGQLTGAAANAESHMQATPPEAEDCDAPDFVEIAKISRDPVKVEFYSHSTSWDASLWKQRRKRGEPNLLTVQELRGVAGCGPFNMQPQLRPAAAAGPIRGNREPQPRVQPRDSRSSGVRGQRWVVLTGLVPVRKQIAAFREYFKDVQKPNPETDVPTYIYYRVERAEVTDRSGAVEPKWSRFNLRKELQRTQSWSGTHQEVVEERYIHPKLVFPLGPLVDLNRDAAGRVGRFGGGSASRAKVKESCWGQEVTHPGIPLKSTEDRLLLDPTAEPETGTDGSDVPEVDMPYDSPAHRTTGRELPGRRLPRHRLPMPRSESEFAPAQPAGPGLPEQDELEYLLFRFFDFTAKPGKQYRYRVRLMLANPNYGIDDRYLDEHVLAKKKRMEEAANKKLSEGKQREARLILAQWRGIETPWSEPTGVISVPRDTQVLAVSVNPPLRLAAEPSAKILVIKWVEATGVEAFTEVSTIKRGQVLNFPDRIFPEIKQPRKPKRDEKDKEGILPGRLEVEHTDFIPVDYVTEAVVLDMQGGNRLPGADRLSVPGEILLLDPDGNLVVRNELDDSDEYEQRTRQLEQVGDDLDRPGEGFDMLREGIPTELPGFE